MAAIVTASIESAASGRRANQATGCRRLNQDVGRITPAR
jgi:hypothetical protein